MTMIQAMTVTRRDRAGGRVAGTGSVMRERCLAEVLRRLGDWGMVTGAQGETVQRSDRVRHVTASIRLGDRTTAGRCGESPGDAMPVPIGRSVISASVCLGAHRKITEW